MELLKEKTMEKVNKIIEWAKNYKSWGKKDYIKAGVIVVAVIVVIANIVSQEKTMLINIGKAVYKGVKNKDKKKKKSVTSIKTKDGFPIAGTGKPRSISKNFKKFFGFTDSR